MSFKDHFSARAAGYARARPTYPPALFAQLAALAPGHALAWDCGTGNGQAAVRLAEYFDKVVATDPSAAQLAQAPAHPKVEFRLGLEKESGLTAGCADLVTAAQAAHWFDVPAFYAEARRVLRDGGVLAIWCYSLLRIAPGIDEAMDAFYTQTVGSYWSPERRHTETAYRTLPFPFPELPFPACAMEADWSLEQLCDYVRTWSAVMRYTSARGDDPVEPLRQRLTPLWGSSEVKKKVRWPLGGRLGRLPARA